MNTDVAAASDSASPSSPEARLQASRAAMRTAMLPESAVVDVKGRPSTGKPGLAPRIGMLLSHPVVSTLRATVQQWWAAHPWRPVMTIGVEAGRQMMVPLAREHPARLLGAAMLGGAILSRWRPWKWLIASAAPALLASMLPTLISRLATRIPVSTLLRLVGTPARPAPEARIREPQVQVVPPPRPTVSSVQ
jgi:pimeloyl-ACP methyl ester carboxylesterase